MKETDDQVIKLLDSKAASGLLGIATDTLRRKVKQNKIKTRRISGRMYFEPKELNRYLGGDGGGQQ